MKAMKKFGALFLMSLKNCNTYKSDLIAGLLGSVVTLAGEMIYWVYVINTNEGTSGYSKEQIFLYYLFSFLLGLLYNSNAAFTISNDIETGKMNDMMLLPENYILLKFIDYLAENMLYIGLTLFLCIGPFTALYSSVKQVALHVLYFWLIVVIAILFRFLYLATLGLLAIWMKRVESLLYFQGTLVGLLSGQVIPLDVLPPSVQNFISQNPFSLTMYVPIRYLLNGEIHMELCFQLAVWILVIYLLAMVVYKKSMKSYQAYGG